MENNSESDAVRWAEDRLASLAPPVGWQPDTAVGLQRFRRSYRIRRTWRRTSVWTGGAVAAMFTCLFAFPGTRVFAQRCVNACLAGTGLTGEVFGNGTPAAHPSEGLVPSSRREPAPDFTRTGVSGNIVRLSDFRGQVVLLNFWATWCAPCNVEIPWFVQFQRKYRNAGFVILGISLDEDGWKRVKPYLQEKQVNYRVILGDNGVVQSYGGVESLPTTFLIDKAGRIAATHTGLVAKKTYEASVKALLAEKY